ncbi:hypothetical protein AGRA3207_005246 [Actinomadura graeca]|uniref:Uncharacterized protein n=1 Tax=Actinomadura graeca TaxID=2750812 RepID=A0ABX8QZE9_9ACTN|nr:hypothetical protein [Actinomadura graeca]QXJ24003.1 hypothetical protein AGRA3207_005246 [Actinomadura graeca]
MLAEANKVGDPYLWVAGPIIVFLALALWLTLTLTASRKLRRPRKKDSGLPNRGAVTGGIIEGSPSQRNRRDAAPTAAEWEAARREAERLEAAALDPAHHEPADDEHDHADDEHRQDTSERSHSPKRHHSLPRRR